MLRLGLISLVTAVFLAAGTNSPAQTVLPRAGVSRAQASFASTTAGGRLPLGASNSSSERSGRSSLLVGVTIGAGTGALLGALWGKHVDKQQVCPAAGPCGGRSNAGPYALVGAAIGGVLGGTFAWIARHR